MPAVQATFRLNKSLVAEYRKAFRHLAEVVGKTDPEGLHKLAAQSAIRFVRNVAAITPPAMGELNNAAKQRGEQAVLSDLLKLAIPTVGDHLSARQSKEIFASASDLLALHTRSRSGAHGRVNPRNRKEKLLMKQAEFQRVVKQLQGKVGFLLAGLNAAAARLGFNLPSWVRKLGARYGSITVEQTVSRIRIRILQNTPYTDNVKDYARHWDFALKKEINALVAMAKKTVENRIKKTGLKHKH